MPSKRNHLAPLAHDGLQHTLEAAGSTTRLDPLIGRSDDRRACAKIVGARERPQYLASLGSGKSVEVKGAGLPPPRTPLDHHNVLVIEDNATTAERRSAPGVGRADAGKLITVRVHQINAEGPRIVASKTYPAGTLQRRPQGRVDIALELLASALNGVANPIVVAGTSYGETKTFLVALIQRELPFIVQLRPSSRVQLSNMEDPSLITDLIERHSWVDIGLGDRDSAQCSVARLGKVAMPCGASGVLFGAQAGGIGGVHRGTMIAISSHDGDLGALVSLAMEAQRVRPRARRLAKNEITVFRPIRGSRAGLKARANIALAGRHDEYLPQAPDTRVFRGVLGRRGHLSVVELFAGAGGMGLGFLLANEQRTYKILHSAEVNPVYVETLRRNHQHLSGILDHDAVPEVTTPQDLRTQKAARLAEQVVSDAGGVDILIGGPPCQGFSMANRNSWTAANPNNKLAEVFFEYVKRLRPRFFLMENVQGMLWTPKSGGQVSVVDAIEKKMRKAGYVVFPKFLDAVWYGVPQHRTRFFLLGIRQDLGYGLDDFGEWGPFPTPTHGPGLRPLVTVKDALADLPVIGNGACSEEIAYQEPSREARTANPFLAHCRLGARDGRIEDHITSRHAEYVIERYKKIPEGGNWEDIISDLTNYADVSRTHSNIYRRLQWDRPSITIGHYRKSMLIHPRQHRGLSLREAARLQSFPDWFRFAGTVSGVAGGLVHKQQQLANAVCPLVTKAVAQFLLKL